MVACEQVRHDRQKVSHSVNERALKTPSKPTDSRSGFLLAIFSSLGSGATTVVGKWNLETISPLLMNGGIFSVATVALTLFWAPFRGWRALIGLSRTAWYWVFLFAITSFVAVWLYWAGIQLMDPSLGAFVNRIEVPIIIALGVLFLKERFTRREAIGAALSLVGIVVMKLTLRAEYSPGFWLVLAGSFFFGLTEFVSKIALRHVEATPLTYWRNLLMAAGYWAALAITGQGVQGLESVWLGVALLGLLGPLLARLLYVLALERMELSKVAVISQLQPVFVLVISFLFLSQLPTAREMIGGLFLLMGCLLMIGGRR